jgi:hypothetical protein
VFFATYFGRELPCTMVSGRLLRRADCSFCASFSFFAAFVRFDGALALDFAGMLLPRCVWRERQPGVGVPRATPWCSVP